MNKLNTNKAFQARLQNAPDMPVQNEHSKDPNSKMDILWLILPILLLVANNLLLYVQLKKLKEDMLSQVRSVPA